MLWHTPNKDDGMIYCDREREREREITYIGTHKIRCDVMKHCMFFSEKENPRFGTRKINIGR